MNVIIAAINYEVFPPINAVLNSLSTILLLVGFFLIKRGRRKAHQYTMTAALVSSSLFLACYLTYHYGVGHTEFPKEYPVARRIYLAILIPHIILAVVNLPLIITLVVSAVRGWGAAGVVGVRMIRVAMASDRLDAVQAALPADLAVVAAAVADGRVAKPKAKKIKKAKDDAAPKLKLTENPDILKTIAHMKKGRPALVIGFAAETETVLAHAERKLQKKGADWIVANDVSPEIGIMGGDRNRVHLLKAGSIEDWPDMTKEKVAAELMRHAALHLQRLTSAAE